MNKPLHSITLYAFSNLYNRGAASFEDILKKAKDAGGQGLEVVAPQMTAGHPNPTDEWIAYFRDACDKYELTPVCYSVYIDNGKHKGRFLYEGERMTDTIASMENAKKLGFPIVRSQETMLPATMEKLLPYAEELDIHLSLELHGPYTPQTPIFREYAELFERKQSEHLGIVMDFSAFASGAPANVLKRFPDDACNKALLNEINTLYATTEIPEKELINRIYAKGGDDADVAVAKGALFSIDVKTAKMGTPYWRTKPDYDGFRKLLKYSRYMHGKFYHMNEDLTCPGIDYPRFVKIMKEEGYSGYIASEYEGVMFDPAEDPAEQISLHIQMLDKLWAEV